MLQIPCVPWSASLHMQEWHRQKPPHPPAGSWRCFVCRHQSRCGQGGSSQCLTLPKLCQRENLKNVKHLFGLQNYHCLISDNLFKEFYWQILVSLMNSRAEGSNGVKVAKTRWAQSWLETNWAGLLLMIQSPLIKNTDKTIVHSVGELNLRLLS